jgi:hypothetical protein
MIREKATSLPGGDYQLALEALQSVEYESIATDTDIWVGLD